ncbi:putative motility protein [Endothiovibrio diazotrophicus]
MDTSGIASDSMLGAQMVKMALDIQASNVAQLLDAVPKPPQAGAVASQPEPVAPDPSSRLGQNIDVRA